MGDRFRARCALFAVALLAACGGTTPVRAPEPALVAVEILRGITPAPATRGRVAILIDASASMLAPAAAGVSRFAAARRRASEVLETLPPDAQASVDAIGIAGSARCGAPARIGSDVETDLRSLHPGGEGSLAEALRATAQELVTQNAGGGSRIVAFSDLEDACGGDLCAAVSDVVASGASLDLVVLGDRPTPSCVSSVAAPLGAPPGFAKAAPATSFRVLPVSGGTVEGSSDGRPVSTPAGAARIVVALDPPLEVGPITLAPGALVRLRVLDFPAAVPPVREWSLEVVASRGTVAVAPPPKALDQP
jgi:hypothetical protein